MTFSVIIPVYNVAPYLKECLNSVLAQTYKDWEAICVDDGSTDGSGKILDEYTAMDNRIRVVHKVNGGEGSARNVGLDLMRGEWIAYLDADDLYVPEFLTAASEMIAKFPQADMLSFGQEVFSESQRVPRVISLVSQEGCLSVDDGFPARVLNTGFFQTIYRRTVFGDLRFCRYKIGADRVYTFQCLRRVHFIAESPVVAYRYRLREGSAMRSKMTLQKRWHRFLFAMHVAMGVWTLRTSFRLRLRYTRPVLTNIKDLIFG